jgi:hypothetical protein
MVFNGYGCRPTKGADIEKVLVRAINAYYKQNPDQVYLAIIAVQKKDVSFTVL